MRLFNVDEIATKVIPNSFCGVKLNADAAGGAISATICSKYLNNIIESCLNLIKINGY